MSALFRKWLLEHGVFDKDLVVLLEKNGIADPVKDLSQLSSEKWNEMKNTLSLQIICNLAVLIS